MPAAKFKSVQPGLVAPPPTPELRPQKLEPTAFQISGEQEEIFLMSSGTAEGYLGIALFGAVIENLMLSNIEGPSDANVLDPISHPFISAHVCMKRIRALIVF